MKVEKAKEAMREIKPQGRGDKKQSKSFWPIELLDRVDDAIVASLQTEVITRLTGRSLHRQTPQSLTLMLTSLDESK